MSFAFTGTAKRVLAIDFARSLSGLGSSSSIARTGGHLAIAGWTSTTIIRFPEAIGASQEQCCVNPSTVPADTPF